MKGNIFTRLITLFLYIIILLLLGTFVLFGIYVYNSEFKEPEKKIVETVSVIKEENIKTKLPEESIKEEVTVIAIKPPENVHITANEITNNKFYYTQLDMYSKMIYDALSTSKENLKIGTARISLPKELAEFLTTAEGESKIERIFTVAINAFECDNPDIFYVDYSKMTLYYESNSLGFSNAYIKNDGSNENYLIDGFYNLHDIEDAESNIDLIIQNIQNEVSGLNDYNKIKYVHDWIVRNTRYDQTLNRVNRNSIYGVLIEKEATCGGYANAFKYIMDKLNINSIVVQGEAVKEGDIEFHAWNYVELNKNWYAIDCTWDDPIIQGVAEENKRIYYEYFLKNEETFFLDHKRFDAFYGTDLKITYPEITVNNY